MEEEAAAAAVAGGGTGTGKEALVGMGLGRTGRVAGMGCWAGGVGLFVWRTWSLIFPGGHLESELKIIFQLNYFSIII